MRRGKKNPTRVVREGPLRRDCSGDQRRDGELGQRASQWAMAVPGLRGRKTWWGRLGNKHIDKVWGRRAYRPQKGADINSECTGKPVSSFKHGLICSGFHFRTSIAGI